MRTQTPTRLALCPHPPAPTPALALPVVTRGPSPSLPRPPSWTSLTTYIPSLSLCPPVHLQWMYIIPVVLFLMMSGAPDAGGQGGGGGGGSGR